MATAPTSLEHLARPSARWDDMMGAATAINPPGLASDPDFDTDNGGWLFDASATELLFIIDQITHAWVAGTELHPHVHWEKSTSAAGAVLWQLDWQISVPGQARTGWATLSSSTPALNSDVEDTQMITPLGTLLIPTGTVSSILIAKLSRIGGDAADTYGADARLLSFDYHIQKDDLGSQVEWTKSALE